MNNKIIDTEKKDIGEYLKMLVTNFCIAFTIFMLFSMVFGMIFAGEEARAGIMYCWGIAGVMLVAVVMQLVFFTPLVIRRLGYAARVALFGVAFYVILTPLGAFFGWFPADMPAAWITWTVIYVVILALLTVLFTLIYRRETRELNEKLERYKSGR